MEKSLWSCYYLTAASERVAPALHVKGHWPRITKDHGIPGASLCKTSSSLLCVMKAKVLDLFGEPETDEEHNRDAK